MFVSAPPDGARPRDDRLSCRAGGPARAGTCVARAAGGASGHAWSGWTAAMSSRATLPSSWCVPAPGKHWMLCGRRGAIWRRSRAGCRGRRSDPEQPGPTRADHRAIWRLTSRARSIEARLASSSLRSFRTARCSPTFSWVSARLSRSSASRWVSDRARACAMRGWSSSRWWMAVVSSARWRARLAGRCVGGFRAFSAAICMLIVASRCSSEVSSNDRCLERDHRLRQRSSLAGSAATPAVGGAARQWASNGAAVRVRRRWRRSGLVGSKAHGRAILPRRGGTGRLARSPGARGRPGRRRRAGCCRGRGSSPCSPIRDRAPCCRARRRARRSCPARRGR